MLAKIGPGAQGECAVSRREHVGAGDVGRKQIGGELDAPHRAAERGGERFDERGLGDARHAFEQHVAVRQERDEHQRRPRARSDVDARDFAPHHLETFSRGHRPRSPAPVAPWLGRRSPADPLAHFAATSSHTTRASRSMSSFLTRRVCPAATSVSTLAISNRISFKARSRRSSRALFCRTASSELPGADGRAFEPEHVRDAFFERTF